MLHQLPHYGVSSVQKMRRLVAETGSSHNNKHYIIWLSSIFPSIFDQMRWFWAWFTAYQSFIALFSPKPILYINSWNFLWSQIEAMSFISERSTVAAVTRRISFTRRKWCVHAWNGSGLLQSYQNCNLFGNTVNQQELGISFIFHVFHWQCQRRE